IFVSYLKFYEKEKAKEAESKARIKKPSEDYYSWLLKFNKDENGNYIDKVVNQNNQSLKDFKYDTKIDIGKEALQRVMNLSKNFRGDNISNKVKLVDKNLRHNTIHSLFTLWVLATRDDYTLSNCIDASNDVELINAFLKACEDHPTQEANSKEEFEASVRYWNDILLKSTEKVKNHRIADIDYDNPDKIKNELTDMAFVNTLIINFMQERPNIFSNKLGLDGLQISEDLMGNKKSDDMLTFWSKIQQIYYPVEGGYLTELKSNTQETTFKSAASIAANRSFVGDIFNKYAGKDLGTIVKEADHSIENYGELYSSYMMMFGENGELSPEFEGVKNIDKKAYIKYLNGKDVSGFKKAFKPIQDRAIENSKKKIDSKVHSEMSKSFVYDMKMNYLKDLLSALPDDDPDKVIELINDNNIVGESGKTASTLISETINNVLSDEYRVLLRTAGLTKKDAFLVDGKTLEEKWGEKYRDVLDPALKDHCYQAELLKAVVDGNSVISARNIQFGKSDRLHVEGEIIGSLPKKEIQTIKHNYDLYNIYLDDTLKRLKEFQKILLHSHPGFDNIALNAEENAKRQIGLVGTTLFRNMERSLSETIQMLEHNDGGDGYSPSDINDKFRELKQATETYYTKRKSIFKKWNDYGTVRLTASEKLKDELPDIITNYAILRQGMGDKLIISSDYTCGNAPIHFIHSGIQHLTGNDMNDVYDLHEVNIPRGKDLTTIKRNRKVIIDALSIGLKQIGKSFDDLLTNNEQTDPYEAALTYYARDYIQEVLGLNVPDLKVLNTKNEIIAKFSDGTFKKRAEDLAKNPVFKEFLKQNKKFDYTAWKKIETDSMQLEKSYVDFINNVSTANPEAAKQEAAMQVKAKDANVISTKQAGANVTSAKQEGAKDLISYIFTGSAERKIVSQKESTLEQRYQRLGDYIAKKILVDPKHKVMLNAIASGKLKYEKVVESIVDIFKEKQLFKNKQVNSEQIRTMIENGDLTTIFVRSPFSIIVLICSE
nr:hypothetical protein [Lachnospiraceae bacterium]